MPIQAQINAASITAGLTSGLIVIAEKLADDIATARLVPGRKVSIALLAKWLRTTPENVESILPAFLECKLLLRESKDIIVSPIDRTGLLSRLDERLKIEQLVTQNAAVHATDDQISAMLEHTSHMKRCALIGDIDRYMLADRRLERLIGEASGLPQQFSQLISIKQEFRRAWFAYNRLRSLADAAELRHCLVVCIAAHDPDRAKAAVADFIAYLRRSF